MVTTLSPKMAPEWGGGTGSSGPGPGPSRWRWGSSLWVRGVFLLLGGIRASATSIPVSLGSSPPCRHHVPSDTEVGRRRGGSGPCEGNVGSSGIESSVVIGTRCTGGESETGPETELRGLGPAINSLSAPAK